MNLTLYVVTIEKQTERINAAMNFVREDGHSLRKAQEQFAVNY